MIIVYTPEGGAPEEHDARSLKSSEAAIVSRTIDQKWGEIKQGLRNEDLDAMRGVVWVLKKRSTPTLRFGDFDPGVEEMVTRFDRREVVDFVENAMAIRRTDSDVTAEQLAEALAEFPDAAADPEHAERVIQEMLAEGPKDSPALEPAAALPDESPSLTSASPEFSTSGSSPTSSTSPRRPSMI